LDRVVKVESHSGYTYAEKPTALEMDGQRWEIVKIIMENRTPCGKSFFVRISDGREFQLEYNEAKDEWIYPGEGEGAIP
jgi:hypothetical protein